MAGIGLKPTKTVPKVKVTPTNGAVAAKVSVVTQTSSGPSTALIASLNGDLGREYQSIISYIIHSQVIKGAQYMNIAGELESHASEELGHAIALAKQIDYLGGSPTVVPKPVPVPGTVDAMLRSDLDGENEAIRNYRERIRQAEAAGEYALANQIREIIAEEQDHQIDLATALGVDVSRVTRPTDRA